jgi:hypothetical protein
MPFGDAVWHFRRRQLNWKLVAGDIDAAIADAFPGAHVEVTSTDGYFELEMYQHGLLRPLKG